MTVLRPTVLSCSPADSSDFFLKVAKGDVSGHRIWDILGEDKSMFTANKYVDIFDGTSDLIPNLSTSGEQLKLVSNSYSDTYNGTGARTVKLFYLDTSFNEQTETITLNGTTAVNTTATNIAAVNGLEIATKGTDNAAAGRIIVHKFTDSSVIHAVIIAKASASLVGKKTVPVGKTFYIFDYSVFAGCLTRGFYISVTDFATDVMLPKTVVHTDVRSAVTRALNIPLIAPEKSVIRIAVYAIQTNAPISASLRGVLIDN